VVAYQWPQRINIKLNQCRTELTGTLPRMTPESHIISLAAHTSAGRMCYLARQHSAVAASAGWRTAVTMSQCLGHGNPLTTKGGSDTEKLSNCTKGVA
jgi:hypothetical protein